MQDLAVDRPLGVLAGGGPEREGVALVDACLGEQRLRLLEVERVRRQVRVEQRVVGCNRLIFVVSTIAAPAYAVSMIVCLSVAWTSAWRALTLLNGGVVLSVSYRIGADGYSELTIVASPLSWSGFASCHGTLQRTSIWPPRSEVTAAVGSWALMMLIVSNDGFVPQYVSLRASVMWSSGTNSVTTNGPVPMGAVLIVSIAAGSTIGSL